MMKSLFCYAFFGLALGLFSFNVIENDIASIPLFLDKTYMIISDDHLNKDFGIVASVSETDSLEDIIGRPLHSREINQYYFKNTNNYINLMQPNIGISFSSDYNGNDLSISDRLKLRLPKVTSFNGYTLVDITGLVKNNFYFYVNSKNGYTSKLIYYFTNSMNVEKVYNSKKVLYSLTFLNNNLTLKKANLNHGFFITLTKTYDIYNSKLEHYITRWNCESDIIMYIDKSVPVNWIPIFKNGLEKWNTALNAANKKCNIKTISYLDDEWIDFRNGNIKYSSITLAPSSMDRTYAIGHSDFNWRTGEIYRGNIMVSGNWIDYWSSQFDFLEKLLDINQKNHKSMCFDNTSKHDKQREEFIQKGIQSVVVHEMGHILGLRHNFKASALVDFENLYDKDRIQKDGLIPSIMDYFNMLINTNNIYDCYDMSCIMDNIEIMDGIGRYDLQTINYGYSNNKDVQIDYDLGPDEFLKYDAMSNTGDISNSPAKYHFRYLNASKYVIDNYDFKREVSEFETYWQQQSDMVNRHYGYLSNSIKTSLKILSSISYNFKGDIINIRKAQKDSAKFLKLVMEDKLFLEDKFYFTYPRCEVGENYYCQGMAPFNLDSSHKEIKRLLPIILTSSDFEELMDRNYRLEKKTISYRLFRKIMNDTLSDPELNPFMQFFMQ